MKTPEPKPISFKPIPGEHGGETCLTIYPPGSWFDNQDFKVFVGGCGVDDASTLAEAKVKLLAQAKADCLRQVEDARATARYYSQQFQRLEKEGLEPCP